MIGEKRSIYIQGREIPAVVSGEDVHTTVTLANGRTIPVVMAEMLSLRTTNPVDANGQPQDVTEYVTSTLENKRFTPLRFTHVEGLDVDAEGNFLTIEDIEIRRGADIAARQLVRAAQAQPRRTTLGQPEVETIELPGAADLAEAGL